jgi:DNA-binding GntR family transcriptional regulator
MGRPLSAVARSHFARTTPDASFWDRTTTEHRHIYEAIAAGDVAGAEAAAAAHVDSLSELYG